MNVSRPHGFAGLETLVSDVAVDLADAERLARSQGPHDEPGSSRSTGSPVVRARFGGMSVGTKWVLGITIAALVTSFVAWVQESGTLSRASAPTTRPTQPPAPRPPSDEFVEKPPRVDPPSVPPNPAPTSRAPAPAEVFAVKPPIGQGLILEIGQIRYCVAEKIRLEVIHPLVDTEVEHEVDRFNARVADYNGRCSQFKYKRGTLERARAEIESQRSTIERLARLQWEAGR